MSRGDDDAGELDHAEEVLGVPFVASEEATKVLLPGEASFDLLRRATRSLNLQRVAADVGIVQPRYDDDVVDSWLQHERELGIKAHA